MTTDYRIPHLYVVGGRQRKKRKAYKNEWNAYEEAVILEIIPEQDTAKKKVGYVTPQTLRPDSLPSITFKASSIKDGKLYACTQTELITFGLPSFAMENHLSIPCLNDVHHVLPTDNGTLLVANTGLDMVLEVTQAGRIRNTWGALGQDPWDRFDRATDYRLVNSTKPHQSHPNYVFRYEDQIWTTRFEQLDAVNLDDMNDVVRLNGRRPHDGLIDGDMAYFTETDGHACIVDMKRRRLLERRRLKAQDPTDDDKSVGWCRGICQIEKNLFVIGFSIIRPTKFHRNVLWLRDKLDRNRKFVAMPTHVGLYDIKGGSRALWEFDVSRYGMDAIFSVHVVTE